MSLLSAQHIQSLSKMTKVACGMRSDDMISRHFI